MPGKKKPTKKAIKPEIVVEGEEKETLQDFKRSQLYDYAKALVSTALDVNNRRFQALETFPSGEKDPLFNDNTRMLSSNGIIFKPIWRIPSEDLNFIADASILIGSINQLFVDEVKLYCKPNPEKGYGFKFKDKKYVPSEEEENYFNRMERLIYLCRSDDCNNINLDRFPAIMEMATRDYNNLDTVTYLITRNRRGEIYSLEYLDPVSIKRVDQKKGYKGNKEIEFVQTDIANNVVEEFEKNRILYRHKNNLSSLSHRNFGWSPLENCITEIMGQLYAAKRNNEKFNVRAIPKKMLTTSARVSTQEREQIERAWENAFYAAANGASVRIPMLFGLQDIQVHDLDWKTEDFYDSFMQWVCSMVLARYGVDSAMLGLNFSRSQALSEPSMDGRQKTSRDRIIGSMLISHEADITDILDPDYNEKWSFCFNGVVNDDRLKKAELQKKENGVSKTLDEIRSANDDPSWGELAKEYFPKDKKKQEKLAAFGLMISDSQLSSKLGEILFEEGEGEEEQNPDDPEREIDDSELDELFENEENNNLEE